MTDVPTRFARFEVGLGVIAHLLRIELDTRAGGRFLRDCSERSFHFVIVVIISMTSEGIAFSTLRCFIAPVDR
jgi:hypothetical protein